MKKIETFRSEIKELFDVSPVLVEVRFPRMGTSSDWYLLEDTDDFWQIVDRCTANVEFRLCPVMDISESAFVIHGHRG